MVSSMKRTKLKNLKVIVKPRILLLALSLMIFTPACGPTVNPEQPSCENPISLARPDALQINFGDVFDGANPINVATFHFQDGQVWTEDFHPIKNQIHAVALNIGGQSLPSIASGVKNNITSPSGPALCQRLDGGGVLLTPLNLPLPIKGDGTIPEGHMWQAKLSAPTAESASELTVYQSNQLIGAALPSDLDEYFLDNVDDVFAPTLEEGGVRGQIKVYSLSEFEFEVRGYRKYYTGEPSKSALRTIYFRTRYARSL